MKKRIMGLLIIIILFSISIVNAETIPECRNVTTIKVFLLLKNLLNIMRLLVPILLIVMASVDLVKIVTSGEPDKKGMKPIIQRAIAAVAIFFTPTIINLLLGLVDTNTSYETCWGVADSDYLAALEEEIRIEEEQRAEEEANRNPVVDDSENGSSPEDDDSSDNPEYLPIPDEEGENDSPGQSPGSGEGGANDSPGQLPGSDRDDFDFDLYGNYDASLVVSYDDITDEDAVRALEVISGAEGTGTSCIAGYTAPYVTLPFTNITIGTPILGWKVFKDGNELATAYGITTMGGQLASMSQCKSSSTNTLVMLNMYANFHEDGCVPQDSVEWYAKNCILYQATNTINNAFRNYCGFTQVPFNEDQWTAIIDATNSGVGNIQTAIREYCNEYKVTNSHEIAQNVMFRVIFSRCFMNANCAYEARRDCEARLFFEGDDSCFLDGDWSNNMYNPNYVYRYGEFLDLDYYNFSNNKCSCGGDSQVEITGVNTCGSGVSYCSSYNNSYFCSLHSREYRNQKGC